MARSRWWTRSLLAVLVFLLTAGLAGYPVYVMPQIDGLRKADAILVIGGEAYRERYRYGFELAEAGWAPNLVLSNPGAEEDLYLTSRCDKPHTTYTVECFVPDPPTTLGEARELRTLAAEHGWNTVIVVTYTPHISRARYIIQKCYRGDLIMSASPADLSVADWAWQYVYQTAGYIRSVVQGNC